MGNPGHRPLPDQEPEPQGEVIRPKFLRGRAARLWDEYAPELIRIGTLTSVDAHMFATWCALAAELEKSPANMNASRIGQMRALASSFGMDASSRARIGTAAGGSKGAPAPRDPDDKPKKPAESYFDRPARPHLVA